ncbi:hypothetical protein [Roseibium sp.]|uniref:hypothetical protein n=1 Tax=Roseibium sp. TaxID=1936156 RepID=UPI0032647EBE
MAVHLISGELVSAFCALKIMMSGEERPFLNIKLGILINNLNGIEHFYGYEMRLG